MRKMMLALLLILPLAVQAFAQDELIWFHNNFPPYEFTEDPYVGEGDCDAAMFEAMEHLEGYSSDVRQFQFARFLELIKTKPNYCYSCLFKTPEREEFMYFSKPYSYSESIMLVTRKEDAPLYTPHVSEDGMIDLAKLLDAGQVVLSVIHARSYGTLIDSILEPHRESEVITTLSSTSSLESQIRRLITMKAYHGVFAYPAEFGWHSSQLNIPENQFTVYPIKGLDTFDPISYTYFGCSKSETGKQVIETINENIGDIRNAAFAKHRNWLDPDTKVLHEAHQPVFLQMNP